MYYYQAFKLPIVSELSFPELLPIAQPKASNPNQISIKFAEVSAQGLQTSTTNGLYYQANESELWLTIPGIARFLVSHGNQILVHPLGNTDEDTLRVFLLGSCMGALLMQRNLFLLHGNAIKMGEHSIAFAGHSGAGKSTVSGAFYKRGYSILADDVCAISSEGHVMPSFPQIKLWQDAATHLGIETKCLRKIRPRIEKFAVPLEHQFYSETLPLKLIYILQVHNKDEFNFELIDGVKKLRPLQNNSYRKVYLKGLAKEKTHFLRTAQLANQTLVVSITRPTHQFKLDELMTLIKEDLTSRGLGHAEA